MQSAFPPWLRVSWFCLSPIGLLFAARTGWEETVWRSKGPQTIGFSLMHTHPLFAIAGVLCCYLLMLWLIPAAVFAILRRRTLSLVDGLMIALCVFITVVIVHS